MWKLAGMMVAAVFSLAASTAVWACLSTYDATTGRASLTCIEVSGTDRAFDVVMQSAGADTFVITASSENLVHEPFITAMRLLLTPRPAAVVFGNYSAGCVLPLGRPSITVTSNHIDIRLRAQSPTNLACTLALKPFVEAIDLSFVSNPTARTYSVNGVAVVPSVQ
jgi:hypothetical protein